MLILAEKMSSINKTLCWNITTYFSSLTFNNIFKMFIICWCNLRIHFQLHFKNKQIARWSKLFQNFPTFFCTKTHVFRNLKNIFSVLDTGNRDSPPEEFVRGLCLNMATATYPRRTWPRGGGDTCRTSSRHWWTPSGGGRS